MDKDLFRGLQTSFLDMKWIAYIFAASAVLFLIGWLWVSAVLAFASGVFSVGLILVIFLFVVEKVLGDVDDRVEIIEKQNRAYADFVRSVALLISVAYLAAFIAFITLK